ncbi:STAS domain-containing protein [Dactylosporangium matsuzakiense]|uniref:STAS domain-containing protein n=1 Tax=Dactylosporangium matsuzakiense TaxID=53360 RepID=UPI003372B8D0
MAHISLSGVVDPATSGALVEVVDRLRHAAPHTAVVDVAEVTFACSTLSNFLHRVRRALPAGAVVTVVHPTPLICVILTLSGLHWVKILEPEGDRGAAVRSPRAREAAGAASYAARPARQRP